MNPQPDTAGGEHPEPQIHDDPALYLIDNDDRDRVELWRDHTLIGFEGIERHHDGTVELQHTIIDPRFGRRGYARCLVTLLLDELAADGWSFISECTYIDQYLHRYPEYRRYEATLS